MKDGDVVLFRFNVYKVGGYFPPFNFIFSSLCGKKRFKTLTKINATP